MAAHDPSTLTAGAALASLRSGALTAEALARACLARVAARDADVRAWTHVDAQHVLEQARELDRVAAADPRATGPLHGLPIGIKDVILTRDAPTQYNSPLYRGLRSGIDASCVTTLRAAGALVFGKTDTVEFAMTGRRALTRNPHDLMSTPGGSSSGSAAAVADAHVPLALGTQTGGSIIRPAAYCGAYGFKPTWGVVSTEGLRHYAPTLDTLGWFARSVEDLSLLLRVFDPQAATAADTEAFALPGARIALCRTPMWARAEPASQGAVEAAARQLAEAGAAITELALPAPMEQLPALQLLVMRAEAQASLLGEARSFPGRLEASLQAQADNADGISRQQLCDALDTAAACRPQFDRLAVHFDAVLAPSVVGEAPAGLSNTGDLLFNGLWTLLHVPCVHLPAGRGPRGLPVGVSLIAPRYADRRLLAVAAAVAAQLGAGR